MQHRLHDIHITSWSRASELREISIMAQELDVDFVLCLYTLYVVKGSPLLRRGYTSKENI